MFVVYDIRTETYSDKTHFAFYASSGEVFAYGNSAFVEFFDEVGEAAPNFGLGSLPKKIAPPTPTEKERDYMTHFLATMYELAQAYARIAELSPEEDDE